MMTDFQLRNELEQLEHVATVIFPRRNFARVVTGVELAGGRGIFHRDGLPAEEFLEEVKARAPR